MLARRQRKAAVRERKGERTREEPKSRKDLEATLSSLPAEQNRSVQVWSYVLVAYFSYTHSSRMCAATRGLRAVSGSAGGGQAAPGGPLALAAGMGEQNRFALLSSRHRGACFGRMVATSPCTPSRTCAPSETLPCHPACSGTPELAPRAVRSPPAAPGQGCRVSF